MRVGVVGASGYVGGELLRLCAGHPVLEVEVVGAERHAGTRLADLYPSLAGAYPTLTLSAAGSDDLSGLDVVFLAMPHGASQRVVPDLVGRVGLVVDLGADFRLREARSYARWYGQPHEAPELLERFAYGLPELFRQDVERAPLVASPGCYPTAAALALAPLVRAGAVEPTGVVVDAASGVSGAGREPTATTHFNAVDEDFRAYGLLSHRHTPEMEQALGAQVLFTPHLAPMNRGILATCYARPRAELDTAGALDILRSAYGGERFVMVGDEPPSTKDTLGSNSAHVTACVDGRTGWLLALCALDNLGKGAAGQALQCANVALGLEEGLGLTTVGLYP